MVAVTLDPTTPRRDTTIDGFRALAVSGVVLSHLIGYRLAGSDGLGWHYVRRLTEPVSQASVLTFFVISGYIITALLLREETRLGRISLPAFYIRRSSRILPPLLLLYATLLGLRGSGYVEVTDRAMAASALFGCNTGIVECDWWVAHTWSLAVEEQFYLVWPPIFLLLPRPWRTSILTAFLIVLLSAFLLTPLRWHSNYISFGCITAGALCAVSPRTLAWIGHAAHPALWGGVGAVLILGTFTPATRIVLALTPMMLAYMIFAARDIAIIRQTLARRPVQLLAAGSYSLYLWQQLFLATPDLYRFAPPPILLLPIVVVLSVVLVERPMIRLGHRLSARWTRPPIELAV